MQDIKDLEKERLWLILLTVFVNIGSVLYLSTVSWSDWRSGMLLNWIDNLLIIGYTIYRRDLLMARLIVFGLIVGWTELAADAWLVDVTKTLDYSIGGGPMVWRSPLWMPFAWEIVTIQFGYLGLRLYESFKFSGLILVGVLGAINIPFYEEMARLTKWWTYSNCKMFFHTPYYIIAGEFLIAIILGFLAQKLRTSGGIKIIFFGIGGGIGIWGSYFLAYGFFEKLIR